MTAYLTNRLLKRSQAGNLRQLPPMQQLIDFSSNDYLGLARSATLRYSLMQEWSKHPGPLNGLGATGSRQLTGNSSYAETLEQRIAQFHRYEAGLLFNCGYMANLGLLSALGGDDDVIFFDAKVHASTHDGIRLSRSKALPFRHNDLEHLADRLRNCSNRGARFVCVESIYSTDGSKAPLSDLCQLAKTYEAHLIVDEAHAVGVYGPAGRGLVAEHHLTADVFAQVVTFGKALGTYGAIVLGSMALKQALINFAHSYIYTTALPFHMLAAIKCSYDLFPLLEMERRQLQHFITFFRHTYATSSETPIQPIALPGNHAVKEAAQKLMEAGFDVRALTSPTVQKGQEVLRLCLHTFNTEAEMIKLHEIWSAYEQHHRRWL